MVDELKGAAESLTRYKLGERIAGDSEGGFFEASAADGTRVLIKLIPEGSRDAQRRLDAWQRTRHLSHPNLIALLDCGVWRGSGAHYCYAIFEYPDDDLGSAIDTGPLSEEETHGVVRALLDALRYLHTQGMAHRAITPRNVVAVGDQVKLMTDSLSEAGDLEMQKEDVRQLGLLLRELRRPEALGEPLETIAVHASEEDVRDRWTLAEIERMLTPPAAEAPATAPPAEEAPLMLDEAAVPEPPPSIGGAPMLPPPPEHARRRREVPSAPPFGFPKWIFAGVGILLLGILLLNVRTRRESAQPAGPPRQSAAPVASPAAAPPSQPVERKPSPLAPPAPAATRRPQWRVVAFTYTSLSQAQAKAKALNSRWPDLRATVFTPPTSPRHFLVVLGGKMSREAALRVQQKARAAGLPRDVYIQNYSE